MDEHTPTVDHSLWRYYQDGGKGFAARRAERSRSVPNLAKIAEKEKLACAVGKMTREKISTAGSERRGKPRTDDQAVLERARQALLGMILTGTADGARPSTPFDEKTVKEQVERMPAEALRKIASLFSVVQAGGGASAPSASEPVMQSLDAELAKRGISLQLSGKVNNVYLSGENANWTVNASAGTDAEPNNKSNSTKGGIARNQHYNNFGQTLGRAAKNFILGH
jgi:hypothetical protein